MDASTPSPQDDRPAADAQATPMMAQYLEIKARHPDCLLFYRMGDFYELFFRDAETAARALGIALTKRGKHFGDDIPMCGVPVHAADHYLQKLIRLDYRVAVAEQIEDPAEAKKRGAKAVVGRAVVRLVTPGTLTEDSLLDAASRNYLAGLTWNRGTGEMALAWADITSGHLLVTPTAADRLAADLARLSPREIVVNDGLLADPQTGAVLKECGASLSPMPASRFDSAAGARRLCDHFGVATLDAFGSFSRMEMAALGGLLDYLVITQVGNVPFLQGPRREDAGGGLIIDAATRANLELVRSQSGERQGSLLATISRTVTPGGSRLLSDWISAPLASPAAINDRLDGVDWCLEHEELREQLRRLLSAMPDLERALARITANRGGPRDLAAVRDSLACAGEAAGILAEAEDWQGFPTLFAAIGMRLSKAPDEIASTFTAALQADLPLLARDGGFIRPGFSPELDENRSLRDDTRQVIAALQTRYAEMTGLRTLRIKHNNILGYFIEVNPQQAQTLQAPELAATFIHRQTIASAVRFTTTELAGLEQKIALASGRALAIEQELFRGFCELVSEKTTAISAVAAALAETDVLVSLAELSREQRFVRPRVDDSLSFHIEGGRHPVVEARLRADGASAFTANSCDLGPAGRRLWLLTGPNMAGKSTFLRQNALITILAQMGSHVPASAAHIGVVDRLFSRVGAADDLARGRSTFMVEMVETAAILNQATERSLVILDEIGRGTATYDGLSIAWAAIEHLHETNRCRTLFATHYHELTALAGRLTQLANATVKVREWKGEVIFLHEVVPGVADRSYGIQVAKLAGLPAAVIQRASRVLRLLEQGRGDSRTLPIDDLPLFSVPHTDNTATEPDHLRNRLAEVRPDELSPREALAVLYDLKKLAEPGA